MLTSTRTFLIAALCAAAAVAAGEDDIRQIEKRWASAVVGNNFAELDKLLSDDLIYAHSTGVIETKKEYLAKLRQKTQVYKSIDHSSLTVKLHGDSAVAHSKVRMTGTNAQGPFDNQLMMIHFWVRSGGQWRLVAHQTTRLQ
jgi:ketosteroid isomerase-like protein